jgi:hypothetical protein
MDHSLEYIFENLNEVFGVIFFVECCLKIIAMGKYYFKSKWDRIDFFIVLTNLLGVLMILVFNYSRHDIWLRIINSFRILRVFRLIKRVNSMNIILDSMLGSVGSLVNVGAIMMLFMYIYSILGVNLFSTVKIQSPLDSDIVNFQTFGSTFLIIFRAGTGENWQ